jgi:nucleotide-binding universal stress UspA family protein
MAAELGAASGLEVEACFGVGEPAAVLAAHVKAAHPAVVLTGRRADPEDPGIGSTLLKVLRGVACPVLVVRTGHPEPCRNVLSAVDLRDVSRRAAMVAATLFPAAEHRLICALDPAWEREVWRTSGLQTRLGIGVEALRTALATRLDDIARDMAGRTGSTVATELVEAVPARAIVGRAKATAADCVVVGRHGQGMLADHLLGSTTLDVIHHTARDVLVVS